MTDLRQQIDEALTEAERAFIADQDASMRRDRVRDCDREALLDHQREVFDDMHDAQVEQALRWARGAFLH